MKNSLKMAWRGYLRDRAFTTLNLLSLVIGLFVAYAAVGYLRFEWSYDSFHQNAESVYRLAWSYRSQDYSVVGFTKGDAATGPEQQRQLDVLRRVTGVKAAAQFITSDVPTFVEAEGRRIQVQNLLSTNTPAAFCSVFTWNRQQGSFDNFASGTNQVLLTARTARTLFGAGTSGVVGKRVKVGPEYFTVAAVVDDVPLNSHLDFTMVLSQPRLPYWGSRVYLQLEPGADPGRVTASLNAAIAASNPRLAADPLYKGHFLQPLTAIHLDSNLLYELKPPGNRLYLLLIGGFAGCILLLTLFNYANLSLAIQTQRSKSIGVRKAMGASGASIAAQIVLEGVGLALLALPVVVVLIAVGLPAFNELMGVAIPARVFQEPPSLLVLTLLAVLMGTLASAGTALQLALKTALTLFKTHVRSPRRQAVPVRKYVVVSQLVLLIGLSAVSYFITKQIRFIDGKDLGFRTEGLLYAYSSAEKQTAFQEKLRRVPGIEAVGNGSSFGIEPFNRGTYQLQGDDVVFDDATQLYLDPAALRAYGLKTTLDRAPGRPLPEPYTLINRTAAEQLAARRGVPAEALIGQTIITEPEYVDANQRVGFPFTVAGIFEDIHVFSLHEKVAPYFITVSSRLRMDGRTIVRYDPATTAQTLAAIRAAYAGLNETSPLEIEFLDEQVAQLYAQDRRTADLVFYFNVIAIVLASIGVVGITLFLTLARTKEIGIRRVLGASSFSILLATTREYVPLVGMALLLSWPVALYVIRTWLGHFAYQVAVQQGAFVVIGLLALLLTAFLVGLIAYRAAQKDPVKSLRSE
jgi:putative ABC transport system permease protein